MPLMFFVSVRSINPPRTLTSPSFRRMSCSIFRWLMIGCWMPPMLLCARDRRDVHDNFMLTSPSGCTRGVTSMFTPTSMY